MPGCAGVGIQSLQLQLWGAHDCHCTATALQPNPRMLVSRTEYPASKMFEGSFEVLGNGEMRVRVECCIWRRNVQDRGAGSCVASELHGREETESAGWNSTQECSVLAVRPGAGRGKVLNNSELLRPGT